MFALPPSSARACWHSCTRVPRGGHNAPSLLSADIWHADKGVRIYFYLKTDRAWLLLHLTPLTPFSPYISLFSLPFFSILSFFSVHRHLDSSSNERPDISSLQRRIKVYFFITEAAHCALTILLLQCKIHFHGFFFFQVFPQLKCAKSAWKFQSIHF